MATSKLPLPVILATSVPRKYSKLKAVADCMPAVNDDDRCLDIGTSHGGLAYHFTGNGQWTYLDVEERNLSIAKHHLRGQFVVGDAADFLNTAADFRLVTCFDTLMYFGKPVDLLKSVYKALDDGGYVLISGVETTSGSIERLRDKLGLKDVYGFVINPGAAEAARYLAEAGLVVDKVVMYCGPMTEIFQTVLDVIFQSSGSNGDRLTQKYERPELISHGKLAALRMMALVSRICGLIDGLLTPWRYGYLVMARKVGSSSERDGKHEA